jgi:hypothetical protein
MKRFPFSKRAIEALPSHDQGSPSREAEYTDMECIGLHLRVSKNGRKFFQHCVSRILPVFAATPTHPLCHHTAARATDAGRCASPRCQTGPTTSPRDPAMAGAAGPPPIAAPPTAPRGSWNQVHPGQAGLVLYG